MSLSTKIETPSVTYEQPIGLYIDGKWVKGKEGKTFETINPTNEKPIVAVHEAGPDGLHLTHLEAYWMISDSFYQMSTLLSLPHEKPSMASGPRLSLQSEATCS
jgi:hypothetical protein